MKWFLISLAIGLAASDKLDRTYLPPAGAQFSGGILGHHDAPLKPPHHTHSGQGPVIGGHEGSQPNYNINREPVNFGDKIPKVPVTTTSYAFSQTTTYPPGEGFETTVFPISPDTGLPINPVTGLPFQLGQENFPNGPIQSPAPNFGTNINLQGPTSAPVNNGSPGFNQFANQPLNQYPGQNAISPGGTSKISGPVYPGQNQGNPEQQGLFPSAAPYNQRIDQYPGQNVVNQGGVDKIPGGNQGVAQYLGDQTVTGQQGFVPSTGSPISLQPGSNQYGVNYDASQGQIPQGTYTGQPINMPNREPFNDGRNPSQYPSENQNNGPSVLNGSENIYRPGFAPSTIPTSYDNGVSRTTPLPGVPSSTSSYSSVRPVYRPERPQAAADRNAVILNYENVRTPNGYSYSFDTSNGIHADESGIVDNGTKAQGSYSYIGDDGKVYSVVYTADENGFQPRGDHLPTPPPIPEAIQRVIDQAAKDEAAGIVHDGSYDEAKYGDNQYKGPENHRRPQKQGANQFSNDQINERKDDLIKPIVGIKDIEYDDGIAQDQFSDNIPATDTGKNTTGKLPSRRPSNQINGNNGKNVLGGNKRVLGDFDSPKGTFDGNSMPITEVGINQPNNYDTIKQGSLGHPVSKGNNLGFNEADESNQNNLSGSKNRGFSSHRPLPSDIKDKTEKYPGSNVNVGAANYPGNGRDRFDNNKGQNIGSGSPSILFDGSNENVSNNFDRKPNAGNKKQTLGQSNNANRRPGSTGNSYNQNKNGRPQGESSLGTTELPSFEEYLKNQQATQRDDTRYHYQQPNNRFEQNIFPTRFSPQDEASTTKSDRLNTEYTEGTTLRPFMTPNVYNKNNRNSQTTPNGYNQNNRNSQSTTRRPFTTIGVTSPSDNTYTDYDAGDDYATEQDIGDDRINSYRYPTENNGITSRPYQPTQTTSRPQNIPGGQRNRGNQKGTVTPGRRTETSGTVSPGYTYEPTTQMPSHNSRFGSTETPRRMKPQQHRPSVTVTDSKTTVGSPVIRPPPGMRPTDYNYQTTGPNTKYSHTNVGSGYPFTGSFPGSGSDLTTPGVSTPQDYYTTTYRPTQGYSSTTAIPPTYGYNQGTDSQVPSGTPGLFQPSRDLSFQTGYHYGPPKSGSINLDGPGFFTHTGNAGVFPTSPTGTYQTTYQQNSDGFPSTTLGPVTPGSQKTFIPYQPGTAAPETFPFGQGNYQNGPSTPDYANTIVTSTPGGKPVFKYPGSPEAQKTTGFEYGPSRPTYSTTDIPSTIGSTPSSLIPSGITGPSQGYSTTYRPGFQTTKDTFEGGPVDGFGRPITPEQDGFHPGFGHPTHGTTRPINNIGPSFEGTDQSYKYPGSYDPNKVIGEDFSGPKQSQRFDPKTGYHY